DRFGLGERRGREALGIDAPVPRGVALEPSGRSAEQRVRAVLVAAQVVCVARAQLRQALEELRLGRSLRLLPAGLPRLVRGEEPLSVRRLDAELVVLLDRERVVVLELQAVRRAVGERPAELVPWTAWLCGRVRVAWAVRLGRGRAVAHERVR